MDSVQVCVAGAAGQLITSQLDSSACTGIDAVRHTLQEETVVIEAGKFAQFRAAQLHQHPLESAPGAVAIFRADTELGLHFFIEILQEELTRLDHGVADLSRKVKSELLETDLISSGSRQFW